MRRVGDVGYRWLMLDIAAGTALHPMDASMEQLHLACIAETSRLQSLLLLMQVSPMCGACKEPWPAKVTGAQGNAGKTLPGTVPVWAIHQPTWQLSL